MRTPFGVNLSGIGSRPVYHSKDEAVEKMRRRQSKSVRWTLKDMTVVWQYIPATDAKNWNGDPAGYGNDPSHEILEKMVQRSGQTPRFTNYW